MVKVVGQGREGVKVWGQGRGRVQGCWSRAGSRLGLVRVKVRGVKGGGHGCGSRGWSQGAVEFSRGGLR